MNNVSGQDALSNLMRPPGILSGLGSTLWFLGIEMVHRICEISLVSQDQKVPS
jgi:hypothetical protein